MFRKILVLVCLLGFFSPSAAEDQAGYVLLDLVIEGFITMDQSGTGGYDPVNTAVQSWMAEAKNAKSEEQIDPVFYYRFKRMLTIIKLAIIPIPDDREGILESVIEREINSFVTQVSGKASDISERGIGVIADALAEEIVNLHIHLDTKDKREELKKKMFFGADNK